MAHLFSRDRTTPSSESKRRPSMGSISIALLSDLPIESPFSELSSNLTDTQLRETAYEIFVATCRSSGGRPLTYIPQSEKVHQKTSSNNSNGSSPFSTFTTNTQSSFSLSLQRSLTSTAASKVKKALGMRSKKSLEKESSPLGRYQKPVTVGELMRVQMKISESTDSRIRRALLRIFAGQLGKRIESMVLPLELLQQLKSSKFLDQNEYEA